MSRRNRIQASASAAPRTQHLTMIAGEQIPLQVNWNAVASDLGSTVNQISWATDQGNVELSGATIVSNLATAQCAAITEGSATIRCTATMVNGATGIQWFVVKVKQLRDA